MKRRELGQLRDVVLPDRPAGPVFEMMRDHRATLDKLKTLDGRVKWWTDGAASPQEEELRRAGAGGWACEGH
eukprot:6726055-Heterocapsa_arctica.AAC.1